MRFLADDLKERYHGKIYKLTLSSGCTCPNRDGTIGFGGCTFCSEGGSGEFASPFLPVSEQISLAKEVIRNKRKDRENSTDREKEDTGKYIAYFQSFTNTYGDIDRLRLLYEETIRRDDIVILSLGTRPDCLGKDVMDLLSDLNRIKPVWVELGLQTVHEKTAKEIRRGYSLPVFEDAYRRLKEIGITVIVHVIFGLPGETKQDMLDTVEYLSGLSPHLDGIKLQMLNILKGTALGEAYEKEPFPLLSMEEYTDLAAESIRMLQEDTVIHRMTGDGPKDLLIAPDWVKNKKPVLNAIRRKLKMPRHSGRDI